MTFEVTLVSHFLLSVPIDLVLVKPRRVIWTSAPIWSSCGELQALNRCNELNVKVGSMLFKDKVPERKCIKILTLVSTLVDNLKPLPLFGPLLVCIVFNSVSANCCPIPTHKTWKIGSAKVEDHIDVPTWANHYGEPIKSQLFWCKLEVVFHSK